jgi:Arc/MetJ-type ribon-helix-helix transcriptional regulator
MHVEITGEVERMIQALLASGQYASADEFIAAMAADWNRHQRGPDVRAAHAHAS